MGQRITDTIITGYVPVTGLYLYYSPHFRRNIWRKFSSLTGERTKKDPAFKGFRQSSNRLKQASPIASSLYKLVPRDVKEHTLYKTLTGEAIKMLKEGLEETVITETLKIKYINPLLETPAKNPEKKKVEESVTRDRVKGMRDFTSFPDKASGVRELSKHRRSFLLQKVIAGQSVEHFTSAGSDSLSQSDKQISGETKLLDKPKRRTKTTSGLICLGCLPECKTLKIWLPPILLG